MIRDDISDRVIHFTKGNTYDKAASILLKIITEKRLLGGIGMIQGGFKCVCFTEAPISKMAYILANPSAYGIPYKPFGIMVEKNGFLRKEDVL